MRTVAPIVFFLALLARPDSAAAQIDNRFAVGGSVTIRTASSSTTGGSADGSFEIRLGHERQGWVPQLSLFSWFDTDVRSGSTQSAEIGQLRVRPLLGGYGYTWSRDGGRTTITADVVGGFTINSFELDAAAEPDFRSRLGTGTLKTSASNTLAIKPEVQVWRDLNDRVGLKISGGYLIARPSVTVTGALGEDTRAVHADTFLITIGFVYSLF
jgi:hypothetical protein